MLLWKIDCPSLPFYYLPHCSAFHSELLDCWRRQWRAVPQLSASLPLSLLLFLCFFFSWEATYLIRILSYLEISFNCIYSICICRVCVHALFGDRRMTLSFHHVRSVNQMLVRRGGKYTYWLSHHSGLRASIYIYKRCVQGEKGMEAFEQTSLKVYVHRK